MNFFQNFQGFQKTTCLAPCWQTSIVNPLVSVLMLFLARVHVWNWMMTVVDLPILTQVVNRFDAK